MSELTVQSNGNALKFDQEKVELIKRTVAKNATDDQLALFLHQAQRTGLDPLARQIHCIMRWNQREQRYDMSIQTAIDGYRLVADRTGKYAGSDDYLFNEGLTQYQHLQTAEHAPVTSTVTVYKIVSGQRVSFTATAAWSAYFPGDKQGFMWKKMPYLMLGKCAEALALRKAFPAELSGMYVREEMEQAGFVDAADGESEVIDVDDLPVVDIRIKEFTPGTEVMVQGKDDEKLGEVVCVDGALVKVKVGKTEYSVKPERLTIIDANQEPLFPDEANGAYEEGE